MITVLMIFPKPTALFSCRGFDNDWSLEFFSLASQTSHLCLQGAMKYKGENVTKGQTIGTIGNSSSFESGEEYHLH